MYLEAQRNNVLEHRFTFSELPGSFGQVRIFFISDLHRRLVAKEIVEQAKGRADLVVIGGDLREQGVPLERVAENLKRLREIGPLYFVWGNNDYEDDYHELDALLLDHKVTILANTRALFESGAGDKLLLMGVDDIGVGRDRLDLALEDCEEEGFRILVSHSPEIMHQLSGTERISLVLSGHTHGGQIRLLPSRRHMKGGVYTYGNTKLLLSNGYGTTLVPLRFRARPQTHVVILETKHSR
ncbi:metallophosphoesterase family protein [Ectobacillus sp. SYSU M60031]|uniref:Metallophosphoesterase family protein n=1 Tax=Ectobacillus ponti TaxID=2961894 RepID=A0AA41X9A0_9BACI|nr:metallophosphoesterase [Ectobacillus ponti]MCP8968730.1 metallophosphoesterase family protein [Ectobacillus ponti]